MVKLPFYIVVFVFLIGKLFAQENTTAFIDKLNVEAENLTEKNTDSALVIAQHALHLSEQLAYKEGRAEALNTTAVCYDIKGNPDAAIKHFIEAIGLFIALKDDGKVARGYSQMGICYFLQYQYDNALLYYGKAIEIYNRTNNKKDLAGVLINQGIVFTYMDKFGEAERNYLQALSIYKETNNISGLSPTYNSLGKIYYNKKKFKTAIDYYLKSEEYSMLSNNKFNLITTYNSLALCYKELKQFGEAKRYSEKSIELSRKIGAIEREMFCYETLAGICAATGDHQQAYENYKAYSDLKDTLFTAEKSEAIAEMQAKFDVEANRSKVKEIELQKTIDANRYSRQRLILIIVISVILISLVFVLILLRNRSRIGELLRQKNEAIQANLDQKELMMGEIHHRVKNNLQMVSSILDLQARELKDEHSIRVIQDSLNRISAISLIHQRLYQSDNIRGIKITTYIHELAFDMARNFNHTPPIELTCDIDDLNMDLETAIPIGLIVSELITNSCKYAFTGVSHPTLKISLKRASESLNLKVSDNGVGKGNATQSGGSAFGTKLINSLCRKLRAELQEDVAAGTHVSIKITNFKLYAG